MLTEPVHPELRSLGIKPGFESVGKLEMNGSINFDYFHVITNHCVVYSGDYIVLKDMDLSYDPVQEDKPIQVYDVESLFNPDDDTEILVIKVSDLTDRQRIYLDI